MKWKTRKNDCTTIVYNPKVTIAGIPPEDTAIPSSAAGQRWPGSSTATGQDRRGVGIVNDPNDWADEHNDPRYIIDLVKRVTTVAVETMRIVDRLAEAD